MYKEGLNFHEARQLLKERLKEMNEKRSLRENQYKKDKLNIFLSDITNSVAAPGHYQWEIATDLNKCNNSNKNIPLFDNEKGRNA